METAITWQSFPDSESAHRTAAILEAKGLEVVVEEKKRLLDSNFIGVTDQLPFAIRLLAKDFERANNILKDSIQVNLEDVDKDYMLLSFSNEELKEVLEKEDEWGAYNVKVAEALLQERNVPFSHEEIRERKEQRMHALATPSSNAFWPVIIGYAALAATLIFGWGEKAGIGVVLYYPGWLVAFIGIMIATVKKTVPDGRQVYYFTNRIRLHGKIFIIAALLVLLIKILVVKNWEL